MGQPLLRIALLQRARADAQAERRLTGRGLVVHDRIAHAVGERTEADIGLCRNSLVAWGHAAAAPSAKAGALETLTTAAKTARAPSQRKAGILKLFWDKCISDERKSDLTLGTMLQEAGLAY